MSLHSSCSATILTQCSLFCPDGSPDEPTGSTVAMLVELMGDLVTDANTVIAEVLSLDGFDVGVVVVAVVLAIVDGVL